jgi:hypothetical protein
MSASEKKYRDTILYYLVYSELIQAARYQGVTTYQAIAQLMGLPLRGSHMGRELGIILGEIAENETKLGRPLLTAVAVGVNGEPGSGFFTVARELGKLGEGADKAAERAFWQAERAAVYEAWARKFAA